MQGLIEKFGDWLKRNNNLNFRTYLVTSMWKVFIFKQSAHNVNGINVRVFVPSKLFPIIWKKNSMLAETSGGSANL